MLLIVIAAKIGPTLNSSDESRRSTRSQHSFCSGILPTRPADKVALPGARPKETCSGEVPERCALSEVIKARNSSGTQQGIEMSGPIGVAAN